jgi:hypothetical protein
MSPATDGFSAMISVLPMLRGRFLSCDARPAQLIFSAEQNYLAADDTNLPAATGLKRNQLSAFENCVSRVKSIR